MSVNFALIGAAGFVAPRHFKAIHDTGNNLVVAVDPHDSVGAIDSYFPNCRFFTEIERFDRHMEKLRRRSEDDRVQYVSICSPNHLHDAHVRLALRVRAHAICEKPLVINPWNLDPLAELVEETGCQVHTVLQLRLHPALVRLKQELSEQPPDHRPDVHLTYVTRRGRWYDVSWKGSEERSGGAIMNIGIHFFDALMWLFGPPERSTVHLSSPRRVAGTMELERARVRWFLSLAADDLPEQHRAQGKAAFRSITIDGEEVEFSEGFGDLHTRVYEDVLAGGGFGIEDSRAAIELVHEIRHTEVAPPDADAHPFVSGSGRGGK